MDRGSIVRIKKRRYKTKLGQRDTYSHGEQDCEGKRRGGCR